MAWSGKSGWTLIEGTGSRGKVNTGMEHVRLSDVVQFEMWF